MLRKFWNLFKLRRLEADIREELEFHRSKTGGHFGNLTLIQDQVHDASTLVWLETLAKDIRYGFRQLTRARVFFAVAVVSLALGIGANTAIFTLIDALLLQLLPVRDPASLVLFHDKSNSGVSRGDPGNEEFSYPFWTHLKAHNGSFEDLCAFRQGTDPVVMHLTGVAEAGPPEVARAHLVSGNYFDVLGVKAAAGRVFGIQDDTLTAPRVAVISYDFWRNRFHRDPAVTGETVVLNGTAFTIVGVAAREFFGERIERPPDFWIPLSWQAQILQKESWLDARDIYWLNFLGRLKPAITMRKAEADVNVRFHQFYLEQAGAHPSPSTRHKIEALHIALKPGGSGISGLRFLYSEPLHILMAVVGIVLLIACANIATLLLARASARRQEFLARFALGASRARLTRQMLTESVLLSMTGGLAGLGFAWAGVKGLVSLLGITAVKMRPDPVVLAFAFTISVLTGLVFGIAPAVRCSRMELRAGAVGRSTDSRLGSTSMLIVLQIALSTVLLLGAGMLAHSLIALQRQDIGFRPENVLVVRTSPRMARYRPDELLPLYRELDARLNAMPGVSSASLASYTPEDGTSASSSFSIQGYNPSSGKQLGMEWVSVGPHFFETLRIPVLLGRTIGPRDTPASPPVAIVNETFVKKYLPNENPVGRRLSFQMPFQEPGFEIVGVVGDSKYYDLREEPKPMVFFSAWQPQPMQGPKGWQPEFAFAGDLLIRTSHGTHDVASAVRRVLNGISSKLPVLEVTTLQHQIDHSLKQQTIIASLCSIFAVLALVLAAVGIYGTLAYSVTRRTTEIGIRMAIGAQRTDVLWLVLRDSVTAIAVGLAVGIPAALIAARWLKSFLFGVPPTDPLAIAAVLVFIAALALLAGYLPARRAAKIDPMAALRYE